MAVFHLLRAGWIWWSHFACVLIDLAVSVFLNNKYYYDWLIDWLFVLRPAQEYFTYKETSPLPVKGYARRLWAGRDLYRATPAVTRGLGFSGLIQRTAPFSRLSRHTRECGGSILTRIFTHNPFLLLTTCLQTSLFLKLESMLEKIFNKLGAFT
jgi:hypothetical protein